jgi:hypothetical protein
MRAGHVSALPGRSQACSRNGDGGSHARISACERDLFNLIAMPAKYGGSPDRASPSKTHLRREMAVCLIALYYRLLEPQV